MTAPRVLLVDDDETGRVLAQVQLERAGYEVVSARGVVEAFSQIVAQRFDVLITDLHMPNPGDGFAVVSAMHHCQPEVLTLIVSGFPDVKEAMEAIVHQADEILAKPFDVKQLPELMRRKEQKQRPPQSVMVGKELPVPSSVEIAHAGNGARVFPAVKETVAIPILRAVAGTHGTQGDRRNLGAIPATRMLGAPSDWCPNPHYTSLLRVRGSSMEPLIHDGDLLAVDSLQTDPSGLDGKIVVAAHEQRGMCVSRLRRGDGLELLESENREYESVSLGKDSGWHVVGKVLWWISAAP